MNGRERIIAALKGEKPDCIPIMLHNFMPAAREAGLTMKQYRENPQEIARTFIESVEKYRYDGVLIDIDTVTLAGACGVAVDFPENDPARSHLGNLRDYSDFVELKIPDLSRYIHSSNWLESTRLIKEHFGDELFVRGNCDQAPFSLASMIRGTENWMLDFYLAEENQVRELLDYCTEVCVQFINLMAQTGCDMVSNGDSPAGPDMVNPDMYEKFAMPYEQKLVQAAHQNNLPYVLHICGNTEAILPMMIETGADGLELDYKTDVNRAFELMHDKCTFLGNIDPSGILAMGSKGQVRKATEDLLNIFSKTNRFVLNAGCALPPGTPEVNLREFIQTAREYK
jgi:uroporphyrinogen decarboxylase